MRHILAIGGLGLVFSLGAGAALAEGPYAAIAFSPTTGQAGSSWNFDTEILAETEAFLQCGKERYVSRQSVELRHNQSRTGKFS